MPDPGLTRLAIIGSGSAGRRHLRAVRALAPDADVLVVRRPTSSRPAHRLMELGATVVGSIDDAVAFGPEAAIIANPAPFHRAAAERVAARGAAVLVEKPLAATSADGRSIADLARRRGTSILVGYHLRFSETPRRVELLVHEGAVGDVTSVDLNVGQHLSQWRPDIDASSSVSARHELGGGVLLELSHELDAWVRLAGMPSAVRATLRCDGAPTDGIVDTAADLVLRTDAGRSGRIHLDMTTPVPVRTWTVRGTDGAIHADLLSGRIVGERCGCLQLLHRSERDERNRAELDMLRHFLDVIDGHASPACTAEDAIAVLLLVDAARRSDAAGGGEVLVEHPPAPLSGSR